jgi:hypothetical protein
VTGRRFLFILAALFTVSAVIGYLRAGRPDQPCQTCYPGTWGTK